MIIKINDNCFNYYINKRKAERETGIPTLRSLSGYIDVFHVYRSAKTAYACIAYCSETGGSSRRRRGLPGRSETNDNVGDIVLKSGAT